MPVLTASTEPILPEGRTKAPRFGRWVVGCGWWVLAPFGVGASRCCLVLVPVHTDRNGRSGACRVMNALRELRAFVLKKAEIHSHDNARGESALFHQEGTKATRIRNVAVGLCGCSHVRAVGRPNRHPGQGENFAPRVDPVSAPLGSAEVWRAAGSCVDARAVTDHVRPPADDLRAVRSADLGTGVTGSAERDGVPAMAGLWFGDGGGEVDRGPGAVGCLAGLPQWKSSATSIRPRYTNGMAAC